jgi:hypothetical protein
MTENTLTIPAPKFEISSLVCSRALASVPVTSKYEAERKVGLKRYVVLGRAWEEDTKCWSYSLRCGPEEHAVRYLESELVSHEEVVARTELEMARFPK